MHILIYLIFAATGLTALVYEIVWQKYLTNITGSEARGSVLILAILLLAIGYGYRYFGQIARRYSFKQLIKYTAFIEIGIGLWSLIFWLGYQFIFIFLNKINSFFLLELFFVVVLIGPAAFLMGGNLPLMTEALSKISSPGKIHARLYISNTAGAFLGALLGGFLFIPLFGLQISLLGASLINLFAGYAMIKIGQRSKDFKSEENELVNPVASISVRQRKLSTLLAWLAGFIALSLQTCLMRILALTFGGSEYCFSLVVASYILLLSLGTKLFAEKEKISLQTAQIIQLSGLILIFISVPTWAYAFHLIRIQMPDVISGFYLYHAAAWLFLTLIIAPTVLPLGATLPLIFCSLVKQQKAPGYLVGKVYSANSLGCACGCIIGGYFSLYFFNLDLILLILIILSSLGLLITRFLSDSTIKIKSRLVIGFNIFVLFIFIISGNFPYLPERLAIGLFHEKAKEEYSYTGPTNFYKQLLEGAQVIGQRDGPNSSVALVKFPPTTDSPKESLSIMINGKSDGNTEGDLATMRLSSLTGSIFLNSNKANSSAVIGFGTGMTSGALLSLPWIDSVTTIEISEEVKDFAHHFNFANGNVTENKRHNLVLDDAFHYFSRNPNTYDLIITQVTNFWMAGTEKIYSQEFYEIIKSRLNDDGLFIQWISLWGLTPETVKIALQTLYKSFPELKVIAYDKSLMLLAKKSLFTSEDVNFAKLNSSITEAKQLLETVGVFDFEQILAQERWIPKLPNSINYQSLDRPLLAYLASKDFYLDASTEIEAVITKDMWQDTLNASQSSLLKVWLTEGNVPSQTLIMNACGGNKINLVEPDWRYFRTPCRDGLIYLMSKDIIKTPELLKPEIMWLKNFSDPNISITPAETISIAEEDLTKFRQLHSVFNTLSTKRLKYRISKCYVKDDFNSLECRKKFISILNDLGLKTEAEREIL